MWIMIDSSIADVNFWGLLGSSSCRVASQCSDLPDVTFSQAIDIVHDHAHQLVLYRASAKTSVAQR